jgi:hypothetical protein
MKTDPAELIASALADTREAIGHLEAALAGARTGTVEGLTAAAEGALFAMSPLNDAEESAGRALEALREFDVWEDPGLAFLED